IAQYAQLVAGSTIESAALLNDDAFDVVIHWDGGRHHAKKDMAAGFCIVNDVVLGIMELHKMHDKVMYIDLDIHHGDGVENAFQFTDRVFTVSLHHYAKGFYPGTGSGTIASARTKAVVNVPLKSGLSDSTLIRIFNEMVKPLFRTYSMAGDPLGKWNLTMKGYEECLKTILGWKKPLVILGGGGYKTTSTARCYAYLTSLVLGKQIPDEIPEHEFFEDYEPDFLLPVDPGRQVDENTDAYVEEVRKLIDVQSQTLCGIPTPSLYQGFKQKKTAVAMPYTNVIFNGAYWKSFTQRPKYTHGDIPDLTGKVAIVTGANSGLGYATTVALAAHGAHVFLACRTMGKALEAIEKAKAEIKNKYPQFKGEPNLDFLSLDLDDMKKCHHAAQEFLKKDLPLHILVNNGGIMTSPFALSADGVEQQFAVNHMGHFVFTTTLLDKIKESQPSRIVMLSSIGHEMTVKGGIDFDTLDERHPSNPATRYGRSKLANLLCGKALARRLANERVYVNMPHPGFVYTDLARNNKDSMGNIAAGVYDLAGKVCAAKPEVGCLNQLYCATSPDIEEKDLRGRYFVPVGIECRPSHFALDEELQEKLWEFSEKLMNEKIKEP
ncbi:Histone deacetylase 8, partial [Modicella reniformis]